MSPLSYLKQYGYNPGVGLLDPSQKYFLLSIPKNASTFLSNVLTHNGWTFTHIDDNRIQEELAVLRDPVERWLSGFSTYASLHLFGYGYGSDHFIEEYNDLVEKIIFTKLIFDDHTTPQKRFVDQLDDFKKTTFFDAEKSTLIENISKYTGQALEVPQHVIDNSKESNYDTQNLNNFFRSRLDAQAYAAPINNSERYDRSITLRERILSVYNADTLLRERANFYGKS